MASDFDCDWQSVNKKQLGERDTNDRNFDEEEQK